MGREYLLERNLPPAGQNLFEKRFRHLQKLLFSTVSVSYLLALDFSTKVLFKLFRKCGVPLAPNFNLMGASPGRVAEGPVRTGRRLAASQQGRRRQDITNKE